MQKQFAEIGTEESSITICRGWRASGVVCAEIESAKKKRGENPRSNSREREKYRLIDR